MDSVTSQDTATPAASPEPTAAQTVGVFDSGIGGFTVARAILGLRPDLNLVYYGDNLHMPYGGRSPLQLAYFARNSIEFLIEQGIDILAVGCNASNSVLGQGELRSYGLPVYDLVSSTIDEMRSWDRLDKLGLLATKATINSNYWQRRLQEAFSGLEIVESAAPEFVPLIEAAVQDSRAISAAVRLRLEPLIIGGATTVIHGCTHYPLLQEYLDAYNDAVRYIDPAVCLAKRLTGQLPPAAAGAGRGFRRLFSSLPGETFFRVGAAALGQDIRGYTKTHIASPQEED